MSQPSPPRLSSHGQARAMLSGQLHRLSSLPHSALHLPLSLQTPPVFLLPAEAQASLQSQTALLFSVAAPLRSLLSQQHRVQAASSPLTTPPAVLHGLPHLLLALPSLTQQERSRLRGEAQAKHRSHPTNFTTALSAQSPQPPSLQVRSSQSVEQ